MYSRELREELNPIRLTFKRKEMEEKYLGQVMNQRSNSHLYYAYLLGIWSVGIIIYHVIRQSNDVFLKQYIFYLVSVVFALLYIISNYFYPKLYNLWHWIFVLSCTFNVAWSLYDPSFISLDNRRTFSFGVYQGMLICSYVDGGTFLPKIFLTSFVSIILIASDLISTDSLSPKTISRAILPLTLCALQIRHQEMIKREGFLEKTKQEEMMGIIQKQIPLPVIIAKLNKKESMMDFLFGNLQAEKQLGITNQSTYEQFMESCFLAKSLEQQEFYGSSNGGVCSTITSAQQLSTHNLDVSRNSKFPHQNYLNENFVDNQTVNQSSVNSLRCLIRRKVENLLQDKNMQVYPTAKLKHCSSKDISPLSIPKHGNLSKNLQINRIQRQNTKLRKSSSLPIKEQQNLQSKEQSTQQIRPRLQTRNSSNSVSFSGFLNAFASNNFSQFHKSQQIDQASNKLEEDSALQKPLDTIPNQQDSSVQNQTLQPLVFVSPPQNQSVLEDSSPQNRISSFLDTHGQIEEFQESEGKPTVYRQKTFQFLKKQQSYDVSPRNSSLSVIVPRSKMRMSTFSPLSTKQQDIITRPSAPTVTASIPSNTRDYNEKSSPIRSSFSTTAPRNYKSSQHSNSNLLLEAIRSPQSTLSYNKINSQLQHTQNNHSLKRVKRQLLKDNQEIDEEEIVQVEHIQKDKGSSIPSRYSVRYRLYRTNEVFVAMIVENESYKKKYNNERLKNELLSNIRSDQHSLVQQSLSQVNSLLHQITESKEDCSSLLNQHQQSFTEVLACLLSMNLLHHSFILFNSFINKSHQKMLQYSNAGITKINITNLIRSISSSLCCEAKDHQRIQFTSEDSLFMYSNEFLLKIMLFSIIRFFVQHSSPSYEAIQISIIQNYQETNSNGASNENSSEEDNQQNKKTIDEECLRIHIKIPYDDKMFNIIESKDLFVFSFDQLLQDELSGDPLQQSTWILRTACQIVNLLGPYSKLHVKRDIDDDEFISISFQVYKDLKVLQNKRMKQRNAAEEKGEKNSPKKIKQDNRRGSLPFVNPSTLVNLTTTEGLNKPYFYNSSFKHLD